jgi:hypothetical protein
LSNLESKSASVDISISNINSVTASNIARLSNLESKSASVDISISNINQYTGSNDTKWTTLTNVTSSLIAATGSYATTGSNSFYGTQVFSGSVFIANNLIVQGSSSIQYISASSVSIGTNIVQLNTANPSVRFAGLTMIDSGSVGGSGSFLYDSLQDEFIFVHRGNGTNITSSHFVLGPETFDNLGNETYLTCNILTKGTGKEHLVDSCIFDNGTTTCIKNNLVGTGTICAPIGTFTNSAGLPSVNIRASDTNFSLLSVLGNQTGDVNWLLMSGYPNAGDFTIRQSDVVNALTINKTSGITSFAGAVCVPQLNVACAGGSSYNIANFLNTTSTTNSQTYFFVGKASCPGRSGFMDFVDNTDCVNGYIAFGVNGDDPATGTGNGLMIKRGACVGINNNNPLRHLHVGPGSDGPLNPNNGVYISNNGTTALIIRDSTNDSEFTTQVQSSGTILGTLTNHDLIIYTCNTERGRICANGKTRFLACGFGSYIFGNPNVSDDGTFIIGSVVGGTPLSLTDGVNAHTYFRFCSGQSVIESDGTMKFMTAGSTNSLILAGTTGIACFSTTNAMIPPVGTTAQRPTATTGMMRYNSTFNLMEFYNGTSWVQMGSGDLATAQCINNTSMCHSVYQPAGTTGLLGQGSPCISLYGSGAPSMATSNTSQHFGTHGGHCGAVDFPGYWAVHLGGARAVNQLKVWIHANSWGYFELQGSNNSGNASGFNQSGNWTTLSFLCSNNSNCQNMGGYSSGCADGTVFSFWYTNNVPFSAYRIKILDSSRQVNPFGTYFGGAAGYVWQLNRV